MRTVLCRFSTPESVRCQDFVTATKIEIRSTRLGVKFKPDRGFMLSVMSDPKHSVPGTLPDSKETRQPGQTAAPSADNTSAPPPAQKLTPEEQLALYEKELKENDWGHQPC